MKYFQVHLLLNRFRYLHIFHIFSLKFLIYKLLVLLIFTVIVLQSDAVINSMNLSRETAKFTYENQGCVSGMPSNGQYNSDAYNLGYKLVGIQNQFQGGYHPENQGVVRGSSFNQASSNISHINNLSNSGESRESSQSDIVCYKGKDQEESRRSIGNQCVILQTVYDNCNTQGNLAKDLTGQVQYDELALSKMMDILNADRKQLEAMRDEIKNNNSVLDKKIKWIYCCSIVSIALWGICGGIIIYILNEQCSE